MTAGILEGVAIMLLGATGIFNSLAIRANTRRLNDIQVSRAKRPEVESSSLPDA